MPTNNVTKVALSVAPEVIKMTVAENASYSNGYAAGYAAGEAAHAGDYQQGYDAGYAAGEEAHAGDYQDGYNAGYAAGEAAHEEDYQRGYQVGYTAGYAAGEEAHAADYQNGYDAGYADGEAAHEEDYQNGYNAGYAASEAAHADDYQNGYSAGYAAGEAAHEEDYQRGYQAGYTAGYAAGEEDGYNAGYTDGFADGAMVAAEELEQAHQEGYDEGYAEGSTVAEEELEAQYQQGYSDGEAAHEEDYQNGYDSGYDDGYAEGAEVSAEELEKARQDGYDEGLADGEALHEEDYQNGYDDGYSIGYNDGYDDATPVVLPLGGTPARIAANPDADAIDVSMILSGHSNYIFQQFQGRITLDVSALGVPGYNNLALTFADEVIVREADPETGELVMSEHLVTFSAMRDSANYSYLTYGMHGLVACVACSNGVETHFSEQQALQFPLKKPSWVMMYDNSQVGPEPAPTLLGQIYVGDNSVVMPDAKARWMFTPENSGIYDFKTEFDDFTMIRCVLRDVNGIAIHEETVYNENITFDCELSAATYYLDLEITGASMRVGMITITLL